MNVSHVAEPAETAWFWTEGHQAAERAADADLAGGHYQDFEDAEQLLTPPGGSRPPSRG